MFWFEGDFLYFACRLATSCEVSNAEKPTNTVHMLLNRERASTRLLPRYLWLCDWGSTRGSMPSVAANFSYWCWPLEKSPESMEGSSERQQPGWQQGGSTKWMVSKMYVCFPQAPVLLCWTWIFLDHVLGVSKDTHKKASRISSE